MTDGIPETVVSASLQKIKKIKTQFKKNNYLIKSETSDSFVNHFDGHFAYLKTLEFYFKLLSASDLPKRKSLVIRMEICKAPTLQLEVLNKQSIIHIMYIEMDNVIIEHNYVKDAHTHTYARTRVHARTHTLYRLIGVKDNVA